VNMWAVVVGVNYMPNHTAADYKDDQNKVLAVHMVEADHRVMAAHTVNVVHTGHSPLVADHHYTLGLGV